MDRDEAAEYIAENIKPLLAIASYAGMPTLAYLLRMAMLEAETIRQQNAAPEQKDVA